jgi:hypothetical protein
MRLRERRITTAFGCDERVKGDCVYEGQQGERKARRANEDAYKKEESRSNGPKVEDERRKIEREREREKEKERKKVGKSCDGRTSTVCGAG